jgi:hypothetical protein
MLLYSPDGICGQTMRKGHRTFGLHHDTAMVFRFNVRFGSKADICSAKGHVRFTPESDIG